MAGPASNRQYANMNGTKITTNPKARSAGALPGLLVAGFLWVAAMEVMKFL